MILGEMLGEFNYLKKVTLNGCPAQKDNHYRIKITAGACNLGNFCTNLTFVPN